MDEMREMARPFAALSYLPPGMLAVCVIAADCRNRLLKAGVAEEDLLFFESLVNPSKDDATKEDLANRRLGCALGYVGAKYGFDPRDVQSEIYDAILRDPASLSTPPPANSDGFSFLSVLSAP